MEKQHYDARSQLSQKDGQTAIDELVKHLTNLAKLRWYWIKQGMEAVNFNIAAKNVIELTRGIHRVRRVRRQLKRIVEESLLYFHTRKECDGIEEEHEATLFIATLMSASIGICLIYVARFQIPANHIYGGMLIFGSLFAGLRLYCLRRGYPKYPK